MPTWEMDLINFLSINRHTKSSHEVNHKIGYIPDADLSVHVLNTRAMFIIVHFNCNLIKRNIHFEEPFASMCISNYPFILRFSRWLHGLQIENVFLISTVHCTIPRDKWETEKKAHEWNWKAHVREAHISSRKKTQIKRTDWRSGNNQPTEEMLIIDHT